MLFLKNGVAASRQEAFHADNYFSNASKLSDLKLLCHVLCSSFFRSSIAKSLAIILRLCVPQLIIRTGWIADQLLMRAKLNELALLEHRDVFAEPAGG